MIDDALALGIHHAAININLLKAGGTVNLGATGRHAGSSASADRVGALKLKIVSRRHLSG